LPDEPTSLASIDAAPSPPRAHAGHYLAAILLALIGGVLGIIGAFVQELRAGFSPLIIVVGAPIIEEVLKPAGVYIGLWRWPFAYRSQLWTAAIAALGGLVFGLVESLIYVTVYNPDGSDAFVLYRFTVTVALHAVASFTFGWGINQRVFDWAAGRGRFPIASRNAFVAAILLHALYNLTAVILSLAGVLDLD
jgi:hypothetical protein